MTTSPPPPTSTGAELAAYLGAKRAELDASRIAPMLCEREEAGKQTLGHPSFLYELKLDGVRIVADKRGGRCRLFYRKQRDATDSYAEVARALEKINEERFVLDGEIVAFDEQGRPDFQRLGHRIQTGVAKKNMRSPIFVPVVYVVFDVLAIGPYDVRGFPLEARKEILNRVIPEEGLEKGLIRRHPTFQDGVELFRLCRQHRLEGVVAKKLGSSYKAGERSTDWLKIKCEIDAEFVIIGWTEGESDRAKLGALDLGAYEGDRLVFRGRVGSGLHGAIIDKLLEMLEPIEVDHPVAEGKYSPKPKRHHCLPRYVASVRYGGFSLDPSGARFLRFPVFRGLRPDVNPTDCTAAPEDGLDLVSADTLGEDAPPSLTGAALSPEPPAAAAAKGTRRIHITAPETPLLSDGTTKGALCTYFEAVAPALLRHAHGRACSLLRADRTSLWPPPKWTPKFVRTITLKAGSRELRGFVIDSTDALLFSVEAMSPSVHHTPYSEGHPDVADFVAIRVTAASHQDRVIGARAVKAVSDEVGLPSAAKVGGPRAVDVLVALGRAPASAVTPLGTLLAHLAERRLGAHQDKVSIGMVEATVTPFAPCPSGAGEAVVAAIPLDWEDDLDAIDVDTVGLGLARERAEDSFDEDALDVVAAEGLRVDVGEATAKIERLIAGSRS